MLVLQDSDLPHLMLELEQHLPYSSSVYHFVREKLKKRFAWPGVSFIVDVLPNLSVCLVRTYSKDTAEVAPFINDAGVFVYSKNPEKLSALLDEPECLDWSRSLYLRAIQWPVDSAVMMKKCEPMGGSFHSPVPSGAQVVCIYFDLEKVSLIPRSVLPDGFTLGELIPNHAEQLVDERNFPYPELNLLFHRYWLEHFPSAAIFRQGSSRPVAYIVYRPEGCLGLGYVDSKYRGKGFFRIVCYDLLMKLEEMGDTHSCAYAAEDNHPSIKSMVAIGGRVVEGYKTDFMEYVPRNWTSGNCLARFQN